MTKKTSAIPKALDAKGIDGTDGDGGRIGTQESGSTLWIQIFPRLSTGHDGGGEKVSTHGRRSPAWCLRRAPRLSFGRREENLPAAVACFAGLVLIAALSQQLVERRWFKRRQQPEALARLESSHGRQDGSERRLSRRDQRPNVQFQRRRWVHAGTIRGNGSIALIRVNPQREHAPCNKVALSTSRRFDRPV